MIIVFSACGEVPSDEEVQYGGIVGRELPDITIDSKTSDEENAPSAFYGIWISASHIQSEAVKAANAARDCGFDAKVYETTDWENLSPEHWYVVSAGEYATKEEAAEMLPKVKAAGFDSAYIKHTGDKKA